MSGWDGWRGEETGRWLPLGPPAPPASPSSRSALGWSPGLTQGTSLQTSECGNIVYSGAPRKDALLPEQMFTNANGQRANPHQAPAPPSSTCWEGQDVCTPSGPMMLRSPEAALWRCQPSLALWHQHVGLFTHSSIGPSLVWVNTCAAHLPLCPFSLGVVVQGQLQTGPILFALQIAGGPLRWLRRAAALQGLGEQEESVPIQNQRFGANLLTLALSATLLPT